MKIIKWVTSLIVLILIGVVISYGDVKLNNDHEKLVETFEKTEADFKFYSIKANTTIDYNLSQQDLEDICIEVINNLGLEEHDIKWEEKWNDSEKQVFAEVKNENNSISIAGIKKNDHESYIIVDILDNKVYKNIVDIYTVIQDTLKKYSSKVDIYTCLAGEYTKKLQMNKYNEILQKILYNMSAKEIDRVNDDNFVSVTAYSKLLNENYLEYLGNKINLNIGLRYSEDEEKTLIYIATPIIKLDY
ncbi:MAG: YwmB family TATA-box binding protein [Romboutsia sp.]